MIKTVLSTESGIGSQVEMKEKEGWNLISVCCVQHASFKVHDLGHSESPAKFLLVFKKLNETHNDVP